MTDLRFVHPNLRQLDLTRADVIACGVYEDQRPMGGLAGLLDWRLAGKLSGLARSHYLVGTVGELVMIPARPKLPFDKLILVGLGPRGAFDEPAFERAFTAVAKALSGLEAKRAIVELPGRGDEAITPERALALTVLGADETQRDKMMFVEAEEARRAMAAFADAEALRVRRG